MKKKAVVKARSEEEFRRWEKLAERQTSAETVTPQLLLSVAVVPNLQPDQHDAE